jgi:hypothetical protein
MDLVLSSNTVGVFNIEIRNHALGISNRIAIADVKMEDLLQAQYEDRASISLFNDLAKFNLKLLLYQINKKWVFLSIFHGLLLIWIQGSMSDKLPIVFGFLLLRAITTCHDILHRSRFLAFQSSQSNHNLDRKPYIFLNLYSHVQTVVAYNKYPF